MRHRAKGRAAVAHGHARRALLRNMALLAVRARRDQHHRRQGEGAAAVRREARDARAPRRPACHPSGRAEDPERDRPHQALQDHRSALRRAAGWLHPDSQAGASPRRWRRDGADRAARRVTERCRRRGVDRATRGPSGPLFLGDGLPRRPSRPCRLLRHWVHTRTRRGAPSTITRTVCRFGYQRRLRRLFAWLTWLPVVGPLSQTCRYEPLALSLVYGTGLADSQQRLWPVPLRQQMRPPERPSPPQPSPPHA